MIRSTASKLKKAIGAPNPNRRRQMSSSSLKDNDVVVCGFARTPIAKMGGSFQSLTAPRLGAHCISEVGSYSI